MNRACRALGLLFLLFSMGTFVKAEDPLPTPGGEEIQAGNKIEWDAKSPNSPAAGKVLASGTVTPAKGWTCKTVTVIVQDTANGKVIGEKAVGVANNAWSHTFEKLPGGAVVRVKATGLFEKGKTKEEKSVDGVLTVKQ